MCSEGTGVRSTVQGRYRQAIRQAVGEVEADLETDRGAEQFAQLRQLPLKRNATNTIRGRTPRTSAPKTPKYERIPRQRGGFGSTTEGGRFELPVRQ